MVKKQRENSNDLMCDVLVIGGGGSGFSAACTAAQKGAKTVIVEKRRTTGGDTALAGGLFAADSDAINRLRNQSNADQLYKRALSYSHWKVDPRIVRAFIYKSGETIGWLEEMGVKFEEIGQYIPTQGPRIMHMPEGMGLGLMKVLVKQARALGIKILTNTMAKKILTNKHSEMIEVMTENGGSQQLIKAKSVIIAAGGYAGNDDLLKKYYPFYSKDLLPVGLRHMGDGLLLALDVGAATEGLGTLLLRGPYYKGPSDVVTVAMEPNTLWVNKAGLRYVDEAIGFNWPESANALNRQPDIVSYTLFDEDTKRYFAEHGLIKGYKKPPLSKLVNLGSTLKKEANKGGVKIADSLEEIASTSGHDRSI